MNIKVVKIPSRKLKKPDIRRKLMQLMREERQEDIKLLNMTTQTWAEEKPTMVGVVKETANRLEVHSFPSGSGKGVKKWWWLEEGTSVRYADLSEDWVSKTSTGRIKSRAGRGRVLRVGRDAKPHRGIQARRWREAIIRIRYPKFLANVRRIVGRGVLR